MVYIQVYLEVLSVIDENGCMRNALDSYSWSVQQFKAEFNILRSFERLICIFTSIRTYHKHVIYFVCNEDEINLFRHHALLEKSSLSIPDEELV